MAPTQTVTKNDRAGKTHAMLRIEQWLEAHGASWEYDPALPLAEIDEANSHRNQARVEPIMDDVVTRYAAEMEQGDQFPPIVVWRGKATKQWTVVDGNQRVAAIELLGRTGSHPAYTLQDPPRRQVEVLTRSANKEHGTPNTDEERLMAAAYLVETHRTKAVDAAKQTGVAVKRLTSYLHRREADRRIAAMGVRNWGQLSINVRGRLGNVRSDVVLKEAAQLAVDAEMVYEAIDPFVTAINKLRTEDGQMSVVRTERDKRQVEIKERGGMRMPMFLRRLNQAVGNLAKIEPEELKTMELSDDYRALLKERVEEGLQQLQAIRRATR